MDRGCPDELGSRAAALRIFVSVVEAETLTRAAQALGLAQSTVSENIAALERALGTRLFQKNGRSLGLTGEGKALVPWAQKMLSLEREARAGVAAAGNRASSILVLGTVESVSAYLLPPLVTALQRTWPKLRVDIETSSCAEIRRRARSGQIDVGLVLERLWRATGFAVSEELQTDRFETIDFRPPLDRLELKAVRASAHDPLAPAVEELFERLEKSATSRGKEQR